jgi:hypothetical protein
LNFLSVSSKERPAYIYPPQRWKIPSDGSLFIQAFLLFGIPGQHAASLRWEIAGCDNSIIHA